MKFSKSLSLYSKFLIYFAIVSEVAIIFKIDPGFEKKLISENSALPNNTEADYLIFFFQN